MDVEAKVDFAGHFGGLYDSERITGQGCAFHLCGHICSDGDLRVRTIGRAMQKHRGNWKWHESKR
jgi:hypothetical protein